jgi:phosphoribosylamine--glycine ligase
MRRILIIGSGGREHAIVWAIRRTAANPVELFCAPGNAGIAQIAQTAEISISDQVRLAEFVEAEKIDLVFVGPEAPLAAGLVDFLAARGVRVVGPTAAAARLEGSKIFAKDFMARHRIPTAAYRVAASAEEAIEFLKSGEFGSAEAPVVIKADGLAAGKGVVVAGNRSEAEEAIADLMVHHVAGREAAGRVVIEEALIGTEASLLLFSDGRDYALMPAARDHKRIGENDTGPNTGGMGSITDAKVLETSIQDRVVREIVEPTLAGAREEGFTFKGILFLGLMLTEAGPKLLEYNVRFGDPETQAILVRLKTDLLSIFDSIYDQTLGSLEVNWTEGSSACVVAANKGYPGKYEAGAIIEGNGTLD